MSDVRYGDCDSFPPGSVPVCAACRKPYIIPETPVYVGERHYHKACAPPCAGYTKDARRRPTMSDRIGELGSLARSLAHRLHLRLTEAAGAGYMMPDAQVTALTDAIAELATIAREAEARALKAVADREKWIDRCYQSDERALKAEAMCEWLAERLEESDDTVLMADTWLDAAREAVKP